MACLGDVGLIAPTDKGFPVEKLEAWQGAREGLRARVPGWSQKQTKQIKVAG